MKVSVTWTAEGFLSCYKIQTGKAVHKSPASFARPDSRGRLSPHGLLFRPNTHDHACANLPDLSAYLQRDGLAQVDPCDRIRLDLAVYSYSFLLQLPATIADRFV